MLWLSHPRRRAPLPPALFFLRLGRNFLATVGIIAFTRIRHGGYHYIGGIA